MGAFGTAAATATAGATGADIAGCAAEATGTATATAGETGNTISNIKMQTTLAGTARTTALASCCAARGCQATEGLCHIETAHGISSQASTTGTASHAIFNPCFIINFACRSATAGTAIAATCANARTGTATTVAAVTIATNPCPSQSFPVARCVTAVRAIGAIRSIAARGTD